MFTFIRPGTMPGLLLSMVKDLPYNVRSAKYMPLSRVQIYSAEDDSMSLNLFVYGEEPKRLTEADVTTTGEETWRAVVCSKSCIVRNGRSLGHGLVRRGRAHLCMFLVGGRTPVVAVS